MRKKEPSYQIKEASPSFLKDSRSLWNEAVAKQIRLLEKKKGKPEDAVAEVVSEHDRSISIGSVDDAT